MFYVHDTAVNRAGTRLAGEGFTGYTSVNFLSQSQLILIEIPFLTRDSLLFGKSSALVSDIADLLKLSNVSPKPLELIQAWILNPTPLEKGRTDWKMKRIVSIWRGTWWAGDDLEVRTRVNCEDGDEIIFLWDKPDPACDVEWVQIM